MFQGVCRAAMVALVSCVGAASSAVAAPVYIDRITSTESGVPGLSATTFTGFNIAPVVSANFVYFGGRWGSGGGIIRYNGASLTNLVSNATLTPDGVVPFSGFTSLSASGTRFAFGATFDDSDGAFLASSTGILSIADTEPISTSGARLFEQVGAPSVDADQVSLWAVTPDSAANAEGIYQTTNRATAQNRIIATGETPIGVPQPFTEFGMNPVNGGGQTLFWAKSSTREGLFLTSGAIVNTFTDNSTPVSNDTTPVTNIRQNFSFDGTFAAFIGEGTFTVPGIYVGLPGAPTRVASLFDAVPGGFGTFSDFIDVAVSGDRVAFTALGPNGQMGLYAAIDGEIVRLVDLASNLEDGRSIASLELGREGFSGDLIAFTAEFTDGGSGVYVLDLAVFPSPGGVLALPAGLLLAMRRRR